MSNENDIAVVKVHAACNTICGRAGSYGNNTACCVNAFNFGRNQEDADSPVGITSIVIVYVSDDNVIFAADNLVSVKDESIAVCIVELKVLTVIGIGVCGVVDPAVFPSKNVVFYYRSSAVYFYFGKEAPAVFVNLNFNETSRSLFFKSDNEITCAIVYITDFRPVFTVFGYAVIYPVGSSDTGSRISKSIKNNAGNFAYCTEIESNVGVFYFLIFRATSTESYPSCIPEVCSLFNAVGKTLTVFVRISDGRFRVPGISFILPEKLRGCIVRTACYKVCGFCRYRNYKRCEQGKDHTECEYK